MILIILNTILFLKSFKYFILLFFFLTFTQSKSQCPVLYKAKNNEISVSVSGNYISSASIQLYSNSNNLFEENLLTEMEGGYSIGLNIKKRIFNDNIYMALSTEFISVTDDNLYQVLQSDSNLFKLDVKEELTVFPLELSIYYMLPNFFTNTNIYFGGGVGTYFGNRKRRLGPYYTETLSRSIHFSMNVLFCTEYMLSRNIAANFEVRFRDAQYGVLSRYPEGTINIDGIIYSFPQEFESNIFIDGIRIGFGLTYFIL